MVDDSGSVINGTAASKLDSGDAIAVESELRAIAENHVGDVILMDLDRHFPNGSSARSCLILSRSSRAAENAQKALAIPSRSRSPQVASSRRSRRGQGASLTHPRIPTTRCQAVERGGRRRASFISSTSRIHNPDGLRRRADRLPTAAMPAFQSRRPTRPCRILHGYREPGVVEADEEPASFVFGPAFAIAKVPKPPWTRSASPANFRQIELPPVPFSFVKSPPWHMKPGMMRWKGEPL